MVVRIVVKVTAVEVIAVAVVVTVSSKSSSGGMDLYRREVATMTTVIEEILEGFGRVIIIRIARNI